MKKILYSVALLVMAGFSTSAFAQLQDEKNVTINMDLQPILKLDMSTSDQVDFVFDNIAAYAGGITRYGATILKVSSSVSWDLYAVGMSNNSASGFMDNEVSYGSVAAGGTTSIPLDAIELHSNVDNISATSNYFLPFQPVVLNTVTTIGQNNIDITAAVAGTPYLESSANAAKFLQGGPGVGVCGDGGSYLTQDVTAPSATTHYLFTIDYRMVPGLPAVFPTSLTPIPAPAYAKPGVYTMAIKYVLLEDQ
jgi:hypothetical protein